MSDDEISRSAERLVADQEEFFESMWPNILSETVIELLAEFPNITRQQIIDALETRRDADATSRLDKAKIRGALRALRE